MSLTQETIVKEMALTREDFARGLAAAMQGHDYRRDGDTLVVGGPNGGLRITFEALPPRKLGLSFVLPRARITIAFEKIDPAASDAFLLQFDRAYQRGGG